MRLLGLDVGAARTGLAVSDELGLAARPLRTVQTSELPSALAAAAAEFEVKTAVVGRPRRLGGELGQQAEAINKIVESLKKRVPLAFVYEDETGSTLAADGSDADAAAVILQGYLSEQARG